MSDAIRTILGPAGAFALVLGVASVGSFGADDPAPSPDDPAKESEPAGAEPGEGADDDAGLPGLDELLGLPGDHGATDEEARRLFEELDPSKQELERKLTAQEAADKLESAVQQMQETAFRIQKVRDTGIVTQRLQSEIISKLDVLIKQAEDSSSSSSSSSSSQSQQSEMQPGQQQQQAAQQQQQQGSSANPGSNAAGGLPSFEQNPGDQLDAARAAWGALPERVREKLIEGTSDYFSPTYRAWTEAYYKRLAEEASK